MRSSAGDLLIRTKPRRRCSCFALSSSHSCKMLCFRTYPCKKSGEELKMYAILSGGKSWFYNFTDDKKDAFCNFPPSAGAPHPPLHLLSELSSLKEKTREGDQKKRRKGNFKEVKVKDNGEQTTKTCRQAKKYKDHDGELRQFEKSCV